MFPVLEVIAGLGAKYGGPSYSVPRLCEALSGGSLQIDLFSVAEPGEPARDTFGRGFRDHRFKWDYSGVPVLKNLRWSAGLRDALRLRVGVSSVVHVHGIWLMPNIIAARESIRARKPFVLSPRGMLAPAALEFSRLKKRIIWNLVQGRLANAAACIHATSNQEYDELRDAGLTNPIAVIPNGIDLPSVPLPTNERDFSSSKTVLYIGRIHPKKGLPLLLQAWAAAEPEFPEWRLRIAGPDESDHVRLLKHIVQAKRLERVSLEPELRGAEKVAAYRQADLFVLATLNENFGLTVAESLAAGTPVICTKGAPWSGLQTEGCGWWIDQGIEALVAALKSAMAMPSSVLAKMGARGRSWMTRDFSWAHRAAEMASVYQWVAGRGPRPAVVRLL